MPVLSLHSSWNVFLFTFICPFFLCIYNFMQGKSSVGVRERKWLSIHYVISCADAAWTPAASLHHPEGCGLYNVHKWRLYSSQANSSSWKNPSNMEYLHSKLIFVSRGCGYIWANRSSGLPYDKIVNAIVEHDTWETSPVHCLGYCLLVLRTHKNTWKWTCDIPGIAFHYGNNYIISR